MMHRTRWEDEQMVGYSCDAGNGDTLIISVDDGVKHCEACQKRIKLSWNVWIEDLDEM